MQIFDIGSIRILHATNICTHSMQYSIGVLFAFSERNSAFIFFLLVKVQYHVLYKVA